MDGSQMRAMVSADGAEWEKLIAALEAHPDGRVHDRDSPLWTSRDVYTHLARWINHSVDQLEARLAGRRLPPILETDDEINARWQQEDRHLSPDEARERAQAAFDRRLRAIEAVPINRWDADLEALAKADGFEHYANHRRYIVA